MADHRATSLTFLRATGLVPVRIRPGQKEAYPDWSPQLVALNDMPRIYEQIEADPESNLAALFAGRYVDIDLDSNDPVLLAAMEHFLPKTEFMWGRASRRQSHRVYRLHEDFKRTDYGPLLRYLKKNHGVEVRGGKYENGQYSVLPGSTHPSGEAYEWHNGVDPTLSVPSIPTPRLLKLLRYSVACALLARYWTPGSRNDLAMAVGGLLWRIRLSGMIATGVEDESDLEDDYPMVITQGDAKNILNAVMDLGGDEETDKRSRLLTFTNTWKKLERDATAKVTGGKVLAMLIGEEGPAVVKALYRLLSDNPDVEKIEQLSEQFVMWYGPGVIVDLKMVEAGAATPWMSREQLRNSLAGENITVGEKTIKLGDLIFSSSSIRKVYGLTFDPSKSERLVETVAGPMVNQWRGFEMRPSDELPPPETKDVFLDYIREIIADGNEEMCEWVLAWLADMLQCPHQKPGTALVLVGVQGAGKTFLGERILGPIIGNGHAAQTNSISTLTDKFNTLVSNKIFLQCDEAIHSYQKDVAARLKSIISDETLTIEPKGVNAFKQPNHLHLLFTSNEESTAIYIDSSPYERRFTISRVSPARAKDIPYWTRMHEWVETARPGIMRFLLEHKYDKEWIRRPVDNEAKRLMQRIGLDPEVSWVVSRLKQGFPLGPRTHRHWFDAYSTHSLISKDKELDTIRRDHWPDRVSQAAIEEDYKDYVRGHGRAVYSGSVMTTIRRFVPGLKTVGVETARTIDRNGQVTIQTVPILEWPTREQILAHLGGSYGEIIDEAFKGEMLTPDLEAFEEMKHYPGKDEF